MAEDYERLVVLLEARIGQFEKAMKQAERAGTTTYQRMQKDAFKATTAIEQQMLASAQAQGRALESVFGQTVERANKSAKESAAFFREVEKGRAAIDQLRASYDPLFAASKRYEAAVEEINRAHQMGVLSAREQAQMLDQVSVAYLGAGNAAGAHSGVMGRLGNISAATSAKLQNAGFQVQDIAVQMMAGTDAARALSMQLPQLLGGFGLVGVAVGTLASIGLPLLASAFGSAEGAAGSFDEAMSAVQNSVSAMNEQAATLAADGMEALRAKYGDLNIEVLRFIDLQAQAARVEAINATRDAMAALNDEASDWWSGEAWGGLQDMFDVGVKGAVDMQLAMERARDAATFEDQLAAVIELRERILAATGGVDGMTRAQFAFYQKVQDSEDALRQLATAAPKTGWLAAAIAQAETLGGTLWDAVKAKAALAMDAAGPGMTTGSADWATTGSGLVLRGEELIPQDPKTKGGRGGGGGGRGKRDNPIESLLQDLQTEREAVTAWYDESLLAINGATEAQLAAIGGRHEAIERLEAEHKDRLRGIRDEADGSALGQAESFFGAMAAATASGGDKMVKATRVFGAAEALINTYRAQAQVLADPKLSFWQKVPAAIAIGAAGMGFVSAIKGGGSSKSSGGKSSGGGGSSSSSAASAEAPAGPLVVTVKGLDPKALFTGQMVMDLYDAMAKEAGSRGTRMVWA